MSNWKYVSISGVPPHEWLYVNGLVVEMPQPVWEYMHEKYVYMNPY